MCAGGFAKCLGISLIPLTIICVLCNILLFFPGGKVVETDQITDEVFYFGGLAGSGVVMIFPIAIFLGLKHNDCCGCCGNEDCGRRFAMFSSILFAAIGVVGSGYNVIVSAVAINQGPKCLMSVNGTNATTWDYPFDEGEYLTDHSMWKDCLSPKNVVHWHLSLFCVLLVAGLAQAVLCVVQVINGLVGALCGDCTCCGDCCHSCCGDCCGEHDGAV